MSEKDSTLHSFGYKFQIKLLVALLTDRIFLEQIEEILLPEYFDSKANQWLVKQIKDYFNKYGSKITLDALKIELLQLNDHESDLLKPMIVEHLRDVNKYFNASDLDYIKEKALTFCKNQKLKSAIMQSITLLEQEKYDKILSLIEEASIAGIERSLGHDYSVDFEERYDETVRRCIKTDWDIINDLAMGGLGAGELGVVMGSTGAGKCVGKDTEIDIEYEEFELQLTDKISMRFKPWDKIELNTGVVIRAYDAMTILAKASKTLLK